jgi:EmrB/QacA subfamily drug resistance transporter
MTSSVPANERTGRPELVQSRRGLALGVIVSLQLMVAIDGTVMNVALPRVQHALGFSITSLSWVLNAYTLAFGGLLLLGGRAGDILGRRRVFVAGAAIFTVASLVGGLAPSGGILLAARAMQGVGAALGAPNTLALISSTFAEGPERNRALGVFSTVGGLGLAIGLILGGALTEWASWRAVLFINVPIGIGIIAAARGSIQEPQRHPGRFDLLGALTSTAGMVLVVYGLIRAASGGWGSAGTVVVLAAGLLLLAGFVALETRAEQPIMPLSLFAIRNRSASYAGMLLLVAAMFGMFFFVIQFLQKELAFSPIRAGAAFLPMALSLFLAARAAPRLIPRFGAKPLIVAGSAFVAAGMLWLTTISVGAGYWAHVFGALTLVGAGTGTAFMPFNMTILAGLPSRDIGAAAGTLQATQQIGSSIGLAALVTVFGTVTGHAQASRPGSGPGAAVFDHGLRAAFALDAAFAVAALLVAVLAIKVRPPEPAGRRD